MRNYQILYLTYDLRNILVYFSSVNKGIVLPERLKAHSTSFESWGRIIVIMYCKVKNIQKEHKFHKLHSNFKVAITHNGVRQQQCTECYKITKTFYDLVLNYMTTHNDNRGSIFVSQLYTIDDNDKETYNSTVLDDDMSADGSESEDEYLDNHQSNIEDKTKKSILEQMYFTPEQDKELVKKKYIALEQEIQLAKKKYIALEQEIQLAKEEYYKIQSVPKSRNMQVPSPGKIDVARIDVRKAIDSRVAERIGQLESYKEL